MKTSALTGAALDWAVNHAEGLTDMLAPVNYCGKWEFGGPIIEREFIGLQRWNAEFEWAADIGGDFYQYGETPLIVAMRCYVASRLGSDVDVPEEMK